MGIREFIYFSPLYGGHYGILSVFPEGFVRFDVEFQSGPINGRPETWKGGRWELICEL